MKKICVVEDDLGILTSLKLYLENSDFEVSIFSSGDGASEFIIAENPNIVILDINLPVKDGIVICQELRKISQVPIIMLTARNSEIDRITGLESGADDYIAKPFSPRELLARIHSILRRTGDKEEEKDTGIIQYNNVMVNTQSTEVHVAGELINLTKNEYDILERIIREDGNMVKREILMKEVIGYDNYMYDRTIDTHIKNLRKKLGDKDMIITVRGKGYRLNK